jgi:peptide-methionine (S)-S-oxide reductase
VGTQYRSVIFYHSPQQEAEARASRDAAQSRFSRPIVTQIVPAPEFWPAEEYHQQYLEKRGIDHCHI